MQRKFEEIRPEAVSDARFRDSEELKYSLRSVEKYAAWVNKIYIVTDQQVPKWLDTNHPKIKIIDHQDIFQTDGQLPNFNSVAIEWLIYRIPDLSEHFVYFNDDFFLGSKIKKEDFFTDEGRPVSHVEKKNWDISKILNPCDHLPDREFYIQNRINALRAFYYKYGTIYLYHLPHVVRPFKKKIFMELIKEFECEFKTTIKNQFRINNVYIGDKRCDGEYQVSLLQLMFAFMVKNEYNKIRIIEKTGMKKLMIEKFLKFKSIDFISANIGTPRYKRKLYYIKLLKPKFFCINDSEKYETQKFVKITQKFLDNYFPQKSDFELS